MVRHGHPTERSNVRTFTRSNDIGRPGQAGIPAGVGGVPGTYTELYRMQEEEGTVKKLAYALILFVILLAFWMLLYAVVFGWAAGY